MTIGWGPTEKQALPGRLCGQRLLTKYRLTQGLEGECLSCVVMNEEVGVPVGSKACDAVTDPG